MTRDTYAPQEGMIFSEMNTIFKRIRGRRSSEPTTAERERLAALRAELTALRAGRPVTFPSTQ